MATVKKTRFLVEQQSVNSEDNVSTGNYVL